MLNLLEQIDFSKDLAQESQLQAYIRDAAKQIQKEESQQILKFKKPVFDQDLENHLIVTNIPDIKGKQDKFIPFFKGFLEKKGIGVKEGLENLEPGFTMVNGEKKYNKTLYMIYKNPAIAKKAYQKLHQLKFDKQHTLACFTVKEFKDVQKLAKQYIEPKFQDKKQLISYNLDEKYRDQFMFTIKQGNKSKLNLKWFDHIEKKTDEALPEKEAKNLTEGTKSVLFSSRGTYVAVCEPKGVRLLVGNDLREKAFYNHEGVTDIIFSPNQTYMITFNANLGKQRMQESYILWAIEPEISLQKFKAHSHQSLSSFQFNSDETRLAIGMTNEFVVYNSDTIQNLKKQLKLSEDDLLAEGRMVKAQNLQKLAWLPDKVSLVCVCYELNPSINSHPSSKIFTYNTQTKQQKKWRAIGQHIKKAEITVSDNNDWVSVFFKKIQKKNLSISVIYIVNLLKRDIETDVVEFKENVVSLSWDKQNGRFGAVYEIPTTAKNQDIKFSVSFYQIQVKDKVQQAVKFSQIGMTPANRIILAQNGIFFALYNVSPLSWGKYKYTLGVFAKDPKTKKLTTQIIKLNVQIPYMTYFDMDASGRFIITGTDKTYQIWTTAGELINKDMFNTEVRDARFRPRYATKLSPQAETKLEQREKDIKKKYEQEDEKRLNALEYQKKKEKEEQRTQFKKYLEEKRAWFAQLKAKRDAIRGFSQQDPNIKSAKYQLQYEQRNGL